LLPALSKARQAALTLQCQSNLRQFGIGFNMYGNDYGGATPMGDPRVPPYLGLGGTNPDFYSDWTGPHFSPYINDKWTTGGAGGMPKPVRGPIWLCPTADPELFKLITNAYQDRHYARIRFSGNGYIGWPKLSHLTDSSTGWKPTGPRAAGQKKAAPPSETALLYDTRYFGYPYGQVNGHLFTLTGANDQPATGDPCLDQRHSNGANFLFADGHVDWIPAQPTDVEYARMFPYQIGFN
jgi:prepilin-type processing-associated H-X9-DG protein